MQLTSLSSLSLSLMAAAKKGRRKHSRCSFLCSFATCFGVSNKVSADHSDRKSVSARAIPVNDPPETAKTSTSEIHDVEQHEEEKKKRKKIAISSADQPIITSKVANYLSIHQLI